MFEELLKKIVSNGNNVFAKNGNDWAMCLISPQKCSDCPFRQEFRDIHCYDIQDRILSKLKLLVRKERLAKLLKD